MIAYSVGIIICTCNRASDLRQTLESVCKVHVPAGMSAEVLVVDNAPGGPTAEVVREFRSARIRVRYVPEARRGKGYAYNSGMAASPADIFLFTDDDVRVPENWIEGMCGPIIRGEADAVAGGVTISPQRDRAWLRGLMRSMMACTWQKSPGDPAEWMLGANMAFSRKVLERVGGFDVELGPGALGFADETLFGDQLQRAGFRMAGAWDVCTEHWFDESRLQRENLVKQVRNLGRSFGYVFYHWEHRTIRFAWLRQASIWTKLKIREMLTPSAASGPPPEWLLYYIRDIALFGQYRIERRRAHNYEKFGLVKRRLDGDASMGPSQCVLAET
jgi:glycosyltransferase involved in cell wall biosynthesis